MEHFTHPQRGKILNNQTFYLIRMLVTLLKQKVVIMINKHLETFKKTLKETFINEHLHIYFSR